MANIIGKTAVHTIDTTGVISNSRVTIQSIVMPIGAGTETVSLVSNGQTIWNSTFSASAEKIYTFPLGLALNNLNVVKSGTSDKLYIYTI